jgi:hypothetical protein
MTRIAILAVALILSAPAAFALCVDCPPASCSYTKLDGTIVVTEAPACGTEVLSGYGFNNCHDVGNCNGCMGWTCYVQEPHGFSADGSEDRVATVTKDDAPPVFVVALGESATCSR